MMFFFTTSVYFIESIKPGDLHGYDETNDPTTTYKRPPLRCVAMYGSGPYFLSTLNFGIISY